MKFVESAAHIAADEMSKVNNDLVYAYVQLIKFLSLYPKAASTPRGCSSASIGSVEYIRKQARVFSEGRVPKKPKPPKTIPDDMVSVILVSYFEISEADTGRIQREHALSMGAENIVGDLLERYIASILEPRGWIWCSGAIVKAVDFIKPPSDREEVWTSLQVKNRDNSENSSSSAIRLGTDIKKWHRTFSRKIGSNWGGFPDPTLASLLSEEGFKEFVTKYLQSLN